MILNCSLGVVRGYPKIYSGKFRFEGGRGGGGYHKFVNTIYAINAINYRAIRIDFYVLFSIYRKNQTNLF